MTNLGCFFIQVFSPGRIRNLVRCASCRGLHRVGRQKVFHGYMFLDLPESAPLLSDFSSLSITHKGWWGPIKCLSILLSPFPTFNDNRPTGMKLEGKKHLLTNAALIKGQCLFFPTRTALLEKWPSSFLSTAPAKRKIKAMIRPRGHFTDNFITEPSSLTCCETPAPLQLPYWYHQPSGKECLGRLRLPTIDDIYRNYRRSFKITKSFISQMSMLKPEITRLEGSQMEKPMSNGL